MRRLGIVLGITALAIPMTVCAAGSQSAGSKEDLSVMAGKMLDETNQARADIKKGDKAGALASVEHAQTELQQIQANAHGATMVPLYQEFTSVSVLQLVIANKNANQSKSNRQSTYNKASSRPESVKQVAGDYTDVTISTQNAQVNLQAAKQALDKGNMKTADQALADVQDGVSVESVEANMPLARARENLILARSAAEKQHYAEVRTALASSAKALDSYADSGRPHSSDARSLERTINDYVNTLQQNHGDAVAKINQWWNATSNWTAYKPAGQMTAAR